MFREGARVHDPQDVCPGCGVNAVWFASDFRAMGKKSVIACVSCKSVFLNGNKVGDLEVHVMPKEPDGQ